MYPTSFLNYDAYYYDGYSSYSNIPPTSLISVAAQTDWRNPAQVYNHAVHGIKMLGVPAVLIYERDKYFPLPLHKMLQHTLKKKQQWVLPWKVDICNSEKRAKKEAANKTLPIWYYFTKHKKHDSPTKHNQYNKGDRVATSIEESKVTSANEPIQKKFKYM